MPPATIVVFLIVGVLLVVGALILATVGRRGLRMCPHPGCEHRNPPEARFCGKCGRALTPGDGPPA